MRRLAISLCTRAQRAAAQATSTGLGQLAHTGNGTRATGRGLASLLAPVSRELPVAPPSSLAASRTSVPLSLHLQQMSSAVAGPSSAAAPAQAEEEADQPAAQGPPASPRRNLMMVYTCGKCDRRSVMTMSKQSYESGVVLVKCPGCGVLHLVADHKGWFGEPGSVEDFLSEKGEAVLKRAAIKAPETGAGGTIELTEEELRGWSAAKGAGEGAAAPGAGAAGGAP